jgi:hypothetical protein
LKEKSELLSVESAENAKNQELVDLRVAFNDMKTKAEKYKHQATVIYTASNLGEENKKIRDKLQKYYTLYEKTKVNFS